MVRHGRVEGKAPLRTEGGRDNGAADGQRAQPQRALHGGVGPQAHLHAHLLGVGPAWPRHQPGAHLREQGLELGPSVAVQVVRGHGGEGPPEEGADAAALALLPAGLLHRLVPAAAWCEAAPEALVGAEGGIDKALHGHSCRKVSAGCLPALSLSHLESCC